MFSDANLPEPLVIQEIENPVRLVEINAADHIFFNPRYTSVRTIRAYTYDLLKQARRHLPENCHFVIYEAYRPMSAQVELWNGVVTRLSRQHPHLDVDSEELIAMCDVFAANPYRQGSGHQSGAAVDISLVDDNGTEYDMGGEVRGFDNTADFDCPEISAQARKNREILREALAKVGMVNYPSEWWHYSFGDRLWARLTGSKLAIFGKLDK
ncbi:MAG: D-alanyl-D-alanine carboxypeptidase family protein [Proteobacteria bacterium]|nr:D-alanyl-D-alanine carboxypeptidase family protein [Pseudomonadota bacterium]